MTSISTTPVSLVTQTGRLRSDPAAETTATIPPPAVARSQSSPALGGAPSVATDGFMTKVFDILHKMQGPLEAASGPVLDAEDVQGMVARLDAHGKGEVTSADFVAARPEHVSEQDAAELFATLDRSGKGTLSLDQLTSHLKPVSETEGDETNLLSGLDQSAVAGVNRDQFLASMQQAETPDDAVKTLLRLLGGKDEGTQG